MQYIDPGFPDGDFVVRSYESNFFMGDRKKALALFKRFYEAFTEKYGTINLPAPVDSLRPGPNGTKWNSGYWKYNGGGCQLMINEHGENYFNVRIVFYGQS